MTDPLDSLYRPDDRDRRIFGADYVAPERFEYGEETLICKLAKKSGDGYPVKIYETRMPARFFKVVALPAKNSVGKSRKGFTITTGSGDVMAEFAYSVAKLIVDGMIGVYSAEEKANP